MIRHILIIIFILGLMPKAVQATENIDYSAFSSLPILHEGRVKPIDSFARVMLKRFSNQEQINDKSAAAWLADSIFDPAGAIEKPLFKIFDAHKYGLAENKNKLYSYLDISSVIQNKSSEIQALIKSNPEKWTPEQQSLIKIYDNHILHTQILRSFSFILPLQNTSEENKSFSDYKNKKANIEKKLQKLVRQKGSNIEKYNKEEQELAALSYQLKILEVASRNNVLLRIVPQNWQEENNDWLSPWAFFEEKEKTSKSLEYLEIWKNMTQSYRANNAVEFNNATANALNFFPNEKLKTEVIYNQLNLIFIAKIFYILSFASIILFSLIRQEKEYLISFVLGFIGLILHGIHIGLRIYILDRPPVGTLYESILFVSFISVLGLLFLAYKQKTTAGILLASISGIILLLTAQGFTSEDTMSTLVAVLNTNFWLSTHVLCISIGYGLCLITSLIAHAYLIQKIKAPQNKDLFIGLMKNLKTLVILSLLFTTIGTILGGIWADQSWGRFWGWDPKENGALLIVLWIIWLLHGRISQHVSEIGFVVGNAFLSVVVILAWFGVNLLNVGLHSYGFITGVAIGIGAFCVAESLLIGGLWFWGRRQP